MCTSASSVVVLDFETTGLSPNMGDRPIEIGAVRLVDGQVTESFQQLMNSLLGSHAIYDHLFTVMVLVETMQFPLGA